MYRKQLRRVLNCLAAHREPRKGITFHPAQTTTRTCICDGEMLMYRLPLRHTELLLKVNCGIKVVILYTCYPTIEPHRRVVNCELSCQMLFVVCFHILCMAYIQPLPCGCDGCLHGLLGSAFDHRSPPPEFVSWHDHI